TKSITLKAKDYYKLVELKGKLEVTTWSELITKLDEVVTDYLRRQMPPPVY
ncbi:unnamed protein product, partial [marine sediment metagenome]